MVLASLIVGSLIGATVALVPGVLFHPTAITPPGGAPPFGFDLNITNASQSDGAATYNLTVSWMYGGNVTTAWTQFYAFADSTDQSVNITVKLLSANGTSLALFNSTESSWKGVASGLNQSVSSAGGWGNGTAVPIDVNDVFEVTPAASLSGCMLNVAMVADAPPHPSEIITLAF
ncbi:MAG: hypothetical protein L3J68_02855 [Thermoplasmata archaeon]|nr:hypothetical protein [Thermoplasmata archaeon]